MSVKKLSWLADLEAHVNKSLLTEDEIHADGWATSSEIADKLNLTRSASESMMSILVKKKKYEKRKVKLKKSGDIATRLTNIYRPIC